jgi:hypothetical protein
MANAAGIYLMFNSPGKTIWDGHQWTPLTCMLCKFLILCDHYPYVTEGKRSSLDRTIIPEPLPVMRASQVVGGGLDKDCL